MLIQKGDIFTRLEIIEVDVEPPIEKEYAKNIGRWHKCKCRCKYNNIVTVPEASLVSGGTKSCGCLLREKAKKQIKLNREQMIKNNKTTAPISKTYKLNFNGETKSMTEWANDIGITKQALSKRLKKMPIEEALTKKGRYHNGN